MPRARTLGLGLVIGLTVAALFAFTLIGVVGEAVALLALVGLLLRATCTVTAAVRRTDCT